MFIKAAALRDEMCSAGFTDNGGAIHSAERILDILGLHLNYSALAHRNGLKKLQTAECSEAAFAARTRGEKVQIEHVSPLRELTRQAIETIKGLDDEAAHARLVEFVKRHYRLVLLTPDEMLSLNKLNRSRMCSERLELAGIKLRSLPTTSPSD
jgi:hypothetical protein